MDITTNELKGMKAKQLRRLVRETIQEMMNETTVPVTIDYKNKNVPDKILDIDPSDVNTINKLKTDPTVGSLTVKDKKIKEGDIEEMARTPKGFRLADENFDATPYADKRVSGTSLQDIINYFRENPGADKKSLQVQFNFARPQIANAVVNALLDAGVLVKLGAGGEVEATPEPGEEAPAKATEPEDLFMGGAENPLAMYFDGEPNADGSEDFEPEAGEIEKAEPTAGGLSDKDYEDFMKYDELKRRLDATKSNILKTRKSRGTAGDIADKPSTELQRLRDLKKSLEDRINDLVAGSDYLKKKLAKDMPPAPPVETPEEEEETLEEGLDEWTLNKLQYYAGIKP